MESMKTIEDERLKWAESYDGKVVMIEQLQRELAHTVEALNVEKSFERTNCTHEHSHDHSRDHSGVFETSSFSSQTQSSPSILQQGGRGSNGDDSYQHHYQHQHQHDQYQQPPPPPPSQYQHQQEQGNHPHEHSPQNLHLPTRSKEPPFEASRSSRHPDSSSCSNSSHSRLIDTLQRENVVFKERVSTLVRRENEAAQDMVVLKLQLEEVTAAWRDSEGKLKFRAQQMQQWETEREARDNIESGLRAQLAAHQDTVAASDKSNTLLEARLQEVTDRLHISEQKQAILLAENEKHVKDFEHFKAQLEFHKSVGSDNHHTSHHTSHITSNYITSNHNTNSAGSTSNHRHRYVNAIEEVKLGITEDGIENLDDAEGQQQQHVASSAEVNDDMFDMAAFSERELNLNKAFQTEVRMML
jgi:hypothetical protein